MTNSQTNFNYAGNGDYKYNTCTTTQLSTMYSCNITIDGYALSSYSSSNVTMNVESEMNFNTTMTGIVVATLDYKNGTSYYKRDYSHILYPLYGGSYKLSFTAMTRKTGTLSDFTFAVLIRSHNWNTAIYFNKTYTFSDYETMNVTENITLPGLYQYGVVYLHFSYTGSNTTAYTSPVGAGITNVRFEKLVCASN